MPTRMQRSSISPFRVPARLVPAQLALVCLLAWCPAPARSQETSGLQVLLALEDVLTSTIARSEKSVVAICRTKKLDRERAVVQPPDPFNRFPVGVFGQSDPDGIPDADFIPGEFGTGVVVGPRGLVLTNFHVLGGDDYEEYNFYVTTHERKTYKAEIKGADSRSDLAVLKLTGTGTPASLPSIKFGDAGLLRKGQIVITLGNPYAIARDGQVSAGWGIVSNLSRKAGPEQDGSTTSKPTLHHYGTLIQTDAKLNLGTSGGPLLNLKGEMVGLSTSLAALAGYEKSAGYAIPVDETFKRVVDTLKEGRRVEYGFLGVQPDNLAPRQVLLGQRGTRIHNVVPGTPAYRDDLRREDLVKEVNGRPVYDADGLVLEVGKMPVESVVRLTVERGGRIIRKDVELAKYRVSGKQVVTVREPLWRGMDVDFVTATVDADLLVRSGYLLDACVSVCEVDKDSPAWQAGVRPDMFITHVDSTPVRTPREFKSAVADKLGVVKVHVGVEAGQRSVLTVEEPLQ